MKTTPNITDRGVAVLSGSLILFVAGIPLRQGALLTISLLGFVLIGIAWFLAPRNLRNLKIALQVPPRFFADRNVPIIAELTNQRRFLGAAHIQVQLRFPHSTRLTAHADHTPPRATSQLQDKINIPARTCSSQVNCQLRSIFPFGLFEVSAKTVIPCSFLVYPRLITPVELLVDGTEADHNPTLGIAVGDYFGEPRGIRQYQSGDPANRIHQRASARSLALGQGLQVRAYDPPGLHPDRCRILFHSCAKPGEIIRLDRFERGLSLIAGTLAHLHAIHTRVTFQADFLNWTSRPSDNRTQYLENLAILARTGRANQTTEEQLTEILESLPTDEQLIIISDSPPSSWLHLIPPRFHQLIVVNIQQIHFRKRRFKLQRKAS